MEARLMDPKPAPMSAASDTQAHARRIRALKIALQKRLSRKPTVIQRWLRDHCAVTMALVEAAAADPHTTANDFRALDSAARRARLEFERVAEPASKPSARDDVPSLAELINR
jgi:hypothetical protein